MARQVFINENTRLATENRRLKRKNNEMRLELCAHRALSPLSRLINRIEKSIKE